MLHRPILPTTPRPPLARTVIARQLIARQPFINRVAAPTIRILVQVSRIHILPSPHGWFVIILARSHASVVDALEGGGTVGEGEGGGGVEVDNGCAGAVRVVAADVEVLAVGGGLVTGFLASKVAAVGGRLGVAGGNLGDLSLAGEVGGRCIGGFRANEEGGEVGWEGCGGEGEDSGAGAE